MLTWINILLNLITNNDNRNLLLAREQSDLLSVLQKTLENYYVS